MPPSCIPISFLKSFYTSFLIMFEVIWVVLRSLSNYWSHLNLNNQIIKQKRLVFPIEFPNESLSSRYHVRATQINSIKTQINLIKTLFSVFKGHKHLLSRLPAAAGMPAFFFATWAILMDKYTFTLRREFNGMKFYLYVTKSQVHVKEVYFIYWTTLVIQRFPWLS